ncbi:DMP19 family protein [Gymnodinialimonas hymeniacidonis]|uniref:DMP19 family protein n=1 Tax=Gymnodinialimonas hymeniacidonis TaxID=3126508 RepID=UPI0034C660DA
MSFISRILPTRTPRPPLLLDEALVQSTGDYADYDCVQAVVNYVNTAQETALLSFDELSIAAAEIYEVDRYLAQVNNGGHGQYWHNCGRALAQVAPLVEGGLRACKAKRHLKIFRHFAKEMRGQEPSANHEESFNASTHFSILDDEFYRVEKSSPVTPAQAKRIRSLKDVVLLTADALPGAFEALAEANPNFIARRDAVAVSDTSRWFTNAQLFTAGLALAQADPPDLFGSLGHGGKMIDIAGQPGFVFKAETLNGSAIVIFNELVCFAHEQLTPEAIAVEAKRRKDGDMPVKGDPDFRDRLWALDGAGRRLSTVPTNEVEAILRVMADLNMGLGAHMLLAEAGLQEPITHAGCLTDFQTVDAEGEVAVLIKVAEQLVMVVANADGARLLTQDTTQVLAEFSAAEITERAEALRKA